MAGSSTFESVFADGAGGLPQRSHGQRRSLSGNTCSSRSRYAAARSPRTRYPGLPAAQRRRRPPRPSSSSGGSWPPRQAGSGRPVRRRHQQDTRGRNRAMSLRTVRSVTPTSCSSSSAPVDQPGYGPSMARRRADVSHVVRIPEQLVPERRTR